MKEYPNDSNSSSFDDRLQKIDNFLLAGVSVPLVKLFKKFNLFFSALELTDDSCYTIEQVLPVVYPTSSEQQTFYKINILKLVGAFGWDNTIFSLFLCFAFLDLLNFQQQYVQLTRRSTDPNIVIGSPIPAPPVIPIQLPSEITPFLPVSKTLQPVRDERLPDSDNKPDVNNMFFDDVLPAKQKCSLHHKQCRKELRQQACLDKSISTSSLAGTKFKVLPSLHSVK
jgi:hypothetical protein